MILNWTDMARADSRISMLRARCDLLRKRVADVRAAAHAALEVERMESRIEELSEQMQNYRNALKSGPVETGVLELIEIPKMLIERRIRLGWSQTQLATALSQPRQVVSRYEGTRYASVSLRRLMQVDYILRDEEIRRWSKSDAERPKLDDERSRSVNIPPKSDDSRLSTGDSQLLSGDIRLLSDDREITQGKEKLGVVAILGSEGVACPFRAADGEFEGKDER